MPTRYFRAVPGSRNRDFEQAISRKLHTRSAELKSAVNAVNLYTQTANADNLRRAVSAILAWKSTHPKEFRARASVIWADLHAQMRAEADRYPGEYIECLDRIDSPPTPAEALNWVNASNTPDGLQQFADYACLDATTFRTCIRGDRSANGPVRRREADWNGGNHPPFGTNAAMAIVDKNRGWNTGKLSVNYQRISGPGGRGAVCTTFGYLAAYVLTRNRPTGPRVELVSYPRGRGSHVFVLVGREGGLTAQNRIPNNWNAVVVDAWAAALGHPCIFRDRNAYVFRSMTQNLQLVMQRPAA